MKRRAFIKSLSAAAATPLLPASAALSSPFSAAQYAMAKKSADLWAYTTVGNLKRTLGVDEATSKLVMKKLERDGIIGAAGPNGLALTRRFVQEQARITAKAATKLRANQRENQLAEKAKEELLKETRDLKEDQEDPMERAHRPQPRPKETSPQKMPQTRPL